MAGHFITLTRTHPQTAFAKAIVLLIGRPIHYLAPASLLRSKEAILERLPARMEASKLHFQRVSALLFYPRQRHGELKGQGVNNVWFIVDPDKFDGTTASNAWQQLRRITLTLKITPLERNPDCGSRLQNYFTNYDDMKHNAVAVGWFLLYSFASQT